MTQTSLRFLFLAVLALASLVMFPSPSTACGVCSCQNATHIIVNCAACDKEIDTYPLQKGNYKSCTLFNDITVNCCNNPKVPEPSSIRAGSCPNTTCNPNCPTVVGSARSSSLGSARSSYLDDDRLRIF